MANDLASLADALRQGAAAKAQTGVLQQRLNSAQQMADTPYTDINPNTGYGSPLQALAMALRRDRGAKQVRELQPQMAELQGQMGAADTAQTMYGLQRDADQTTYTRSRNAARDLIEADERQWQRGADERALKLARKKYDMKAGEATAGKYQNVNTGDIATASVNDRTGRLEIDGKPVNQSEWVKYDAPKATGKGGKGGGSGDLETGPTDILPTLAAEFQDKYANPVGIPLAGSASNLAAREAGPLSSDDMKERQRWWSNFKGLYENPLRHELFGSALTAGEQTQWANSMINPNMDAGQIRAKLNDLMRLDRVQQERLQAMDWLQQNPDSPLAEGVRARLSAELGRRI